MNMKKLIEKADKYVLSKIKKHKHSIELFEIDNKAGEKWNCWSLEVCKEELGFHYRLIKEIVSKAKP